MHPNRHIVFGLILAGGDHLGVPKARYNDSSDCCYPTRASFDASVKLAEKLDLSIFQIALSGTALSLSLVYISTSSYPSFDKRFSYRLEPLLLLPW